MRFEREIQMKLIIVIASMLAVATAFGSEIIGRPPPARERPGDDFFTKYDSTSFGKLPEARRQIDPQHIDQELLDAAVFHETNRRRQQHGLPALAYDARARAMAQIQARAMAK